MKKVGLREKTLIRDDAKKGINQTGGSTGSYASEQYKKYKANWMKRFTDRTGARGTKLKAYSGVAVVSNETSFKNYTLTGAMFRDMFVTSRDNECTVSFASKDRGKVLGALDHDDLLAGLSEKNIAVVIKMILGFMDKDLREWAKKDLVIIVK